MPGTLQWLDWHLDSSSGWLVWDPVPFLLCHGKLLGFVFPCFSIKKESFTRATGLAAAYFSVLSPLFSDLPCAAQDAGHFGPWTSLALSRHFCLSPSFRVDLSLFLLRIPSSPSPGPGIIGQSQSLLGASSPPPLYTLLSVGVPFCLYFNLVVYIRPGPARIGPLASFSPIVFSGPSMQTDA